MFKNKMLVLLSLVSFGSVLCSKDDESTGKFKKTTKAIKACLPVAVAGLVATGTNMFLNAVVSDESGVILRCSRHVIDSSIATLNKVPVAGPYIQTFSKVVSQSRLVPIGLGFLASVPLSKDSASRAAGFVTALCCSARGLDVASAVNNTLKARRTKIPS